MTRPVTASEKVVPEARCISVLSLGSLVKQLGHLKKGFTFPIAVSSQVYPAGKTSARGRIDACHSYVHCDRIAVTEAFFKVAKEDRPVYEKTRITLGAWSQARIDKLLVQASRIDGAGSRIAFLSRHFLDTPYGESTLIGSDGVPEELVVNLAALDCFTFIDYIEAMRLASSFADFLKRLREIRYREGVVSYVSRNHFFTDWKEFNGRLVSDVTAMIGRERTRQSSKTLNRKTDGSLFLEGIPARSRTVDYIPSTTIDQDLVDRLHNGDYTGIYTDTDGLDVSHVGIVIKESTGVYLRHASSAGASRRVIDQLFGDYVKEKPGVVVLRPRTI